MSSVEHKRRCVVRCLSVSFVHTMKLNGFQCCFGLFLIVLVALSWQKQLKHSSKNLCLCSTEEIRRNKAQNRTEENSSDIFCCWHQRCFPSNSILVQIHLSLCRSVKLGRCWHGYIVWHDLILKKKKKKINLIHDKFCGYFLFCTVNNCGPEAKPLEYTRGRMFYIYVCVC